VTNHVAIVSNVLDYAGPPAVEALVAEGMFILCHAPEFSDEAARKKYESAHQGHVAAIAQSPEDLIAECIERFGRIDAIVSNDAGDIRRGAIETRTVEDYSAVLDAFSVRPFRLVAAAVPHMKAQSGGRIILITSGAPLRPSPQMSIYSAARAATNTLVKCLATELAPYGIAINAIAPFYLQSNYFPHGMDDPAMAKRIRAVVPMQRFGRPDEIGQLIALLASGKADFVSGQIIAFSGGGA
jgi:3-oxoacyl-[acyl-carrier protein] reductase